LARAEVGTETTKTPDSATPAVSTASDSSHPAEADSAASNETTSADQTDQSPAVIHPPPEEATKQLNAVSPPPDKANATAPAAIAVDADPQPPNANEIADESKPDTPLFGERGQLSIDESAGLAIIGSNYSSSEASSIAVSIVPALDYFVVESFSIGGFIYLRYEHSKSYRLMEDRSSDLIENELSYIGLGPRIGYNVTFGDSFSWYIKLGVSYGILQRNSQIVADLPILDSTERIVAFNGFAPLLAHVATHFYIGFGPSLYTEVSHSYGSNSSNDTKETRIGAQLTVGGWL